MKERLDKYLTDLGYFETKSKASAAILAGHVKINDEYITKAGFQINPNKEYDIVVKSMPYVSRGGFKLKKALDAFNFSPAERICFDAGASTGGFTDCLLQNGAARVYCVDAGHGQLHPTVAGDPRVRSAEGCNARFLAPQVLRRLEPEGINPDGSPFSGQVDGCVMDVSFISQTLILPALATVVRPGGFLVSLIKPQFEAGASALSRHGVVTREKDRQTAVGRVLESAQVCGFLSRGVIPSPIEGGDGNREFIAYFIRVGL